MAIAAYINNPKDRKLLIALIISVIIVFLLAFAGCSKKYCQEKYPCIEKDSISIVETANIDTIYIPMPADTVQIETQIDCPDQKIIYKDGKTEYKVIIKDKVLQVFRIDKKDSLRVIYAYKNTEEFKKLTQIKEVEVIKNRIPKWVFYLLGINLLLLLYFTRKFWIRFLV